jgi:hypothetical protein
MSARTTPTGALATPMTKGATVVATLAYVEAGHGRAMRDAVVARMPPAMRDRLSALEPTAEHPYAELLALWRAADTLLHERDPEWMERSGAHSIEAAGAQWYRGILRKRSPNEFLTQSVSLFQLFYTPGDMEVVEEEGTRAVLRLSGFDSGDPLFCRRQTGGLRQAILLAGGEHPRVKHVRCAHEGDAFCEWELTWRGTEEGAAAGERGGDGRGHGASDDGMEAMQADGAAGEDRSVR